MKLSFKIPLQYIATITTVCLLFFACVPEKQQTTNYTFDLQGHRGCRGLMPENSLAAFEKAMQLGVNTLELDLAVSADSQLVVSHEPWFSAIFCADSLGNPISEEDEKQLNIHAHSYAQIKLYDCGSKGNPLFTEQQKKAQVKPLLSEVSALAKRYAKEQQKPLPNFNIEIKSSPAGDGVYHPSPAVFSDLLYQFLQENLPKERVTVQSFDVRVLRYWHANYPDYSLAFLVGNQNGIDTNLQLLDFTPSIYSPAFKLMDKKKVEVLHEKGMKVIPWTVNETEDIAEVLSWGVDGLISDYPDRALAFRKEITH
jgi:glycerophosphoryl diester phosphodiesterase